MRQAGLSALQEKKWKATTVRVAGVRVADDLLDRDFAAASPEQHLGFSAGTSTRAPRSSASSSTSAMRRSEPGRPPRRSDGRTTGRASLTRFSRPSGHLRPPSPADPADVLRPGRGRRKEAGGLEGAAVIRPNHGVRSRNDSFNDRPTPSRGRGSRPGYRRTVPPRARDRCADRRVRSARAACHGGYPPAPRRADALVRRGGVVLPRPGAPGGRPLRRDAC